MKNSFLLLTGAALLLVSCAKVQTEEVVTDNGKHKVTLKATVDEQTRVSVDRAGVFSWQAGDRISILTSDGSYTSGDISEENPGATADFDVWLDDGVTLGRYAYYPYAYRDEYVANNEFVLAEDWLEYKPGETFMPMLGEVTANGAIFKAVGGVLKVAINNIPPDAHFLELFVEGKKISGVFPITVVNGHKQITAEDEDYGNSIFISFGDYQEEEYDAEFYIPLPCGTYNTLTFNLYEWEASDEYALFSKTAQITGGLEVHRNEVIITPPLNVVVEKNTPNRIEFEEPYGYTLDENRILHLDRYDDPIIMTARIYGKNENKRVEDVDEDLFSCKLVDVTDPDNVVETDIDFNYDEWSGVTMDFPTDNVGEFILKVTYGDEDNDPDNVITAESFKFKVYPVVPIPAALGDYWNYRDNFARPPIDVNSDWFKPYWTRYEGNVYLKTRMASLRTEALPDYAFRGSFRDESKGGTFDAFEYFSQIEAIPTNAFYECFYLTGINLPSSVTSIGTSAFNSCQGLTGIDLPSGLTSIGNSAFSGCYNLSSMQLPSGVTSIGGSTFSGCGELTSINLDNVLSIGASAFSGCESLTGPLQIGGATIGDNAFNSCTALQGVTIGSSTAAGQVPMIGAGAFSGCASLSAVNLPNSMVSIGDDAFYNCGQLTNIVLPSSLETIGIFAFNSTGLTSLTIPASVTSIGRGAFRGCAFEYVIMEGENPADIGEAATDPDEWWIIFDAGVTIYVPSTAVAAYQAAWPVLASRIEARP